MSLLIKRQLVHRPVYLQVYTLLTHRAEGQLFTGLNSQKMPDTRKKRAKNPLGEDFRATKIKT
ncbi:hypothetical protein [Pseudomonas avellanae]|uniref:hypothetical protein n=1 Tax=Pseudomonas avellanae TaxID=46257 RepID=UPI001185DC94|nr:hypothetical protein [Pseudomonas avellanae]